MVGLWLLVMGGHTAEAGWFRQRSDTFHNDVAVLDRTGVVQWRALPVGGDAPPPRELHSLTALSGGRLLLFGGALPALAPHNLNPKCLIQPGRRPEA